MTESVFFYKNKLPIKGEFVAALITEVECMMGVTCQLLEYGNLECLMPLSAISRQRHYAVSRHIKIGQTQILQVVNIDEKKGYVDVSKQDISEEDKKTGTLKYKKAKKVHEIIKRVSVNTGINVELLYENFVWNLYEEYDHPLDAFKSYIKNEPNIKNEELCNAKVPQELVKLCKHHFSIEQIKIVAEIEIKSFEGGIDVIKDTLSEGLKIKGININLIASPCYLISTTTYDAPKGIELVEQSIELIKKKIDNLDDFKIKKAPYVLVNQA